MADRIPWQIEGDYIEACSCDYGCPCNFNGFPTKGLCEAIVAFAVEKGSHGSTDLAGVKVLSAVKWPSAIHEGNGTLALFVDEKTSQGQRDALIRILTAQDGGLPWEILATTVTELKGPFFVPVTFEANGTKTKASVKSAEAELTPHTNPVTGTEHEVHTVLRDGFVWTDGLAAVAKRNVVDVDGVSFDWTGQNAYYAKVNWSNAELHEGARTKFGS